jgi:hypothetical protein
LFLAAPPVPLSSLFLIKIKGKKNKVIFIVFPIKRMGRCTLLPLRGSKEGAGEIRIKSKGWGLRDRLLAAPDWAAIPS